MNGNNFSLFTTWPFLSGELYCSTTTGSWLKSAMWLAVYDRSFQHLWKCWSRTSVWSVWTVSSDILLLDTDSIEPSLPLSSIVTCVLQYQTECVGLSRFHTSDHPKRYSPHKLILLYFYTIIIVWTWPLASCANGMYFDENSSNLNGFTQLK